MSALNIFLSVYHGALNYLAGNYIVQNYVMCTGQDPKEVLEDTPKVLYPISGFSCILAVLALIINIFTQVRISKYRGDETRTNVPVNFDARTVLKKSSLLTYVANYLPNVFIFVSMVSGFVVRKFLFDDPEEPPSFPQSLMIHVVSVLIPFSYSVIIPTAAYCNNSKLRHNVKAGLQQTFRG